jgi:hypothetical protein
MLSHAALVTTDVSEEHIASITGTGISVLGTPLAVTSKQKPAAKKH